MDKHIQKQYPFRTDDIIIKKIDYIAEFNTRNRNQQIEHFLKKCISEYEEIYGELTVEEDGTVHPKSHREKSSISKSG